MKTIRDIATKIIRPETDENITEEELNIGTEKEFRLTQIRKFIDSYCGNVENIAPLKTTHSTIPHLHLTKVNKCQIQAQIQHPF